VEEEGNGTSFMEINVTEIPMRNAAQRCSVLKSSLPATLKRLGNYSEAKWKLKLERFKNILWNRWRHTCSVILNT
jgi:hypothetical protein